MSDVHSLLPIATGKRMIAFGDLNCPFCYVLEQRLQRANVVDNVEWRLVEHAPALPHVPARSTGDEQQELEQELTALQTRAPDVTISRPPFRPSSGPGIRAVVAANRVDPRAADELRRHLFSALWEDGRNIADPDVIKTIASDLGFTLPHPTSGDAASAREWTSQWRAVQFNRIPCLVSENSATLLGLAEVKRLDLFLRSGLFGSRSDDACLVSDE